MSTTFNKIAFGSAAAFVTAAAALTPAQQANAAALKGSFHFVGQGNPATTAILKSNKVDFQPDENSFIDISLQSGSFMGITEAEIFDINSLPGVGDPLLEKFFVFTDNEGGADDAKFSITEVFAYQLNQRSVGTAIDLEVQGFFTSSTGDVSNGNAIFTFQSLKNLQDTQAAINSGSGLQTTFSGASFATVPEPATMAGLSLVAVGMALAGRRKKA